MFNSYVKLQEGISKASDNGSGFEGLFVLTIDHVTPTSGGLDHDL